MDNAKLLSTTNEDLIKFFKRATELKEGKSPFSVYQLETEILRRLNKNPLEKVSSGSVREVGDGHDEFS